MSSVGRVLDGVGAKARLTPEVDVCTFSFGLMDQPRISVLLPSLDGLWIALIGASQGFLHRQIKEQRIAA